MFELRLYRVYVYAESRGCDNLEFSKFFTESEAQLKISNWPIIHTRKVYGRPINGTCGR